MFSQTDLNQINAAIASGELTIRRDGKEVTYRSVAELRLARQEIIADLQRQGVVQSAPSMTYAQFSRD